MSDCEEMSGLNNGFGTESPGEQASLEQASLAKASSGQAALEHAFGIVDAGQRPIPKRGTRVVVGRADEIPVGGKKIVEAEGLSIGVFNIEGRFHAIRNLCPHAGAPLCQGHIQTTHRPGAVGEFQPALAGRVLRCPWHGWEFDIVTGKGLYDRNSRVATYVVEVDEDGGLVVVL